MARTPLFVRKQSGGVFTVVDERNVTGDIYWVDPTNGASANGGQNAEDAFDTLQAGIDACTADQGDLIIRMNGTETVTSTIAFNKSGISVAAQGFGHNPFSQGENFATLADAAFTDGPVATVTATCAIKGLGFVSRDTGATFYDGAAMLIGGDADATPFGVHVQGCRFPKWNVSNRIGVAIEGSSDCMIEECDFEGVGADFASGIYVQGATQNLVIRRNHFRDCTYAILFGSFAGGGPHCLIHENLCEDSKLLSAGSAATGLVCGNWLEGATDTGSYSVAVDTLNGYGLVFCDQHYAE